MVPFFQVKPGKWILYEISWNFKCWQRIHIFRKYFKGQTKYTLGLDLACGRPVSKVCSRGFNGSGHLGV